MVELENIADMLRSPACEFGLRKVSDVSGVNFEGSRRRAVDARDEV